MVYLLSWFFQRPVNRVSIPVQLQIQVVSLLCLRLLFHRHLLLSVEGLYYWLVVVARLVVVDLVVGHSQPLCHADHCRQEINHALLLVEGLLGYYVLLILFLLLQLLLFHSFHLTLQFFQLLFVLCSRLQVEGLEESWHPEILFALVVEVSQLKLCLLMFQLLSEFYPLRNSRRERKLLLQFLGDLIFGEAVRSSQISLFLFSGLEGQEVIILFWVGPPERPQHGELKFLSPVFPVVVKYLCKLFDVGHTHEVLVLPFDVRHHPTLGARKNWIFSGFEFEFDKGMG